MEVFLDIVKAYDIERCFGDKLARMAVLVDSSGAAQTRMRDKLQDAAQKRRVTIVRVEAGSSQEIERAFATYVDKIFRGAKPSDLPVEQPTRFELVINEKTAKLLGLKVTLELLLQADKVIE